MNPFDASRPLTEDELDLLASAEVDGDFDAAARDLGWDPPQLRVRLVETDFAARVAALLRLRNELRGPDPDRLDDLTARRLVSTALSAPATASARASSVRASSGRSLRILGVAAALAVVAGLGIGLFARSGDDSGTQSANRAASQSRASSSVASDVDSTAGAGQPKDLGPLGDVSDPGVLRRLVRTAIAAGPRPSGKGAEGSGTPEPAAPSAARCVDPLTDRLGDPGVLLAFGAGDDHGRAVEVLVFEREGRHDVWVLDATTCTVVSSQSY